MHIRPRCLKTQGQVREPVGRMWCPARALLLRHRAWGQRKAGPSGAGLAERGAGGPCSSVSASGPGPFMRNDKAADHFRQFFKRQVAMTSTAHELRPLTASIKHVSGATIRGGTSVTHPSDAPCTGCAIMKQALAFRSSLKTRMA